VDKPFSLNSILLIVYLDTIFPLDALPFMTKSAKSSSHFNFLIDPVCLRITFTISDSPFGFAVKYKIFESLFPMVKS